jgi:hypothetical protein
MGILYRDSENNVFDMHVQDGPEGTKQPVHGLSEDIVEALLATQTAAERLAGAIFHDGEAGDKMPVKDEYAIARLDTLVDALLTFDGDLVTPRLATLHSDLQTLTGHVDLVETKLDTLHSDLDGVETKLDALIAGVTVATMPAPVNAYGQGSVGTPAAQIAAGASLALKYGIRIKNLHATQDLYVGFDNLVTNLTGIKIRPYEEAPFAIANRSSIWLYGSGASTTYCWWTA